MASITRVTLALFIIGFWVFLPISLQWLGITGFSIVAPPIIEEPDESGLGFFEWLRPITQSVSIYFKILTFNIPDIFPLLRYFLNFLQLATVTFILFMLRGN